MTVVRQKRMEHTRTGAKRCEIKRESNEKGKRGRERERERERESRKRGTFGGFAPLCLLANFVEQ